ncbi:MAG: hypothetical protein GEV04_06735 [Actinophytocola sp.]|nr:hypothetical protein [Actinophytocola sp.]
MTPPPDLNRRVSRNEHDIEDLYLMLDETNKTVSRIAVTQQEHSAILTRHGAILDSHTAMLDSLTTKVNDHSTKLDEVLTILRNTRGSN